MFVENARCSVSYMINAHLTLALVAIPHLIPKFLPILLQWLLGRGIYTDNT